MTIDGPNTPPDPPLPMVRLVVRIFPSAMANSSPAPTLCGSSSAAGTRAIAERQDRQRLIVATEQVVDRHGHDAGGQRADRWTKGAVESACGETRRSCRRNVRV